MVLQRGDLVRWICDYNIYAAFDDGVVGYDPIYRHGVVVEAAHTDQQTAVVFCFNCVDEASWTIINITTDEVEILNKGSL